MDNEDERYLSTNLDESNGGRPPSSSETPHTSGSGLADIPTNVEAFLAGF